MEKNGMEKDIIKKVKLIFSILDEIKKLTIVKYNKSLQDKIEINLIKYSVEGIL